jgi:hypothetical protein
MVRQPPNNPRASLHFANASRPAAQAPRATASADQDVRDGPAEQNLVDSHDALAVHAGAEVE